MPSLWIWLSLLYALQSSVSSDGGVSLICNDKVEVKAGETVTLNCTIKWHAQKDRVGRFFWKANDTIICTSGSMKNICTSDNETYVSLTITNVTKEEDITAEITTDYGMADSSIKVKLTGISLICHNIVQVKAGHNVTLNCTIKWQPNQHNCSVLTFDWKSTNGTSICTSDPTEGICTSDYQTYVSLTITNITKAENITVHTHSNCGKDISSVKVKLTGESNKSHSNEDQERREEDITLALSVTFGVFATAIVVVTLYLLFKTDRCRKIIKPVDDRGSYSSTPQA